MKEWSVETLAVQAGYEPKEGESRVMPLVQSTTYAYPSADTLGDLFDLKIPGHIYTRISNPTVAVFEEKIRALEGGVAAVATASGQSATTLVIMTLCEAQDRILALSNLYGGTRNLLTHTAKKMGIEVDIVSPGAKRETVEALITERTRFILAETIGNPGVEVVDIEALAAIAHHNHIPLVVDNTFATPILCRPLEHGADLVIHSSSKYLDGHAVALGGVVVDGGSFPWDNGKFPAFVEPEPSYHGLSFTESFGNQAFAARARTLFIRDVGFVMNPMNAWLTNLGMETLALRMKRHSESALAIAKFLESHPAVEWVRYPGLHPDETVKKMLPSGASGVLAFGVRGGEAAAKKLADSLELFTLVTHVADVRSCVLHPATTTHRQLSEEEMKESGIQPNQLRLSVGIEDLQDLLKDLRQALQQI